MFSLQAQKSLSIVLREILESDVPDFLLNILLETGFDTQASLELLTNESIKEIEEYVNQNRNLTINTIYEQKEQFKLLPGHRALMLSFPRRIQLFKELNNKPTHDSSTYSFILQSLMEAANLNANKHSKAYRYNDIIKYFSIYIYLHCGRACFETLCANLPIPKALTIRKFVQNS